DGNVSHLESNVLQVDLFEEMESQTVAVTYQTHYYDNDTIDSNMGHAVIHTDFWLHGLVTEGTGNGLYGGTIEVMHQIDVEDFNYDLGPDDVGTLTFHDFEADDWTVSEWGDELWVSGVYYVNDTEIFEAYYMEGYESYGNGDFDCADGSIIEFYMANDGYEDCADGSDEPMDINNDNKTDNYFECDDGSMVPMDVVNDYNDDCNEGEDEGKEFNPGSYGLYVYLEEGDVGDLVIEVSHPSAYSPPGPEVGFENWEDIDMANATATLSPEQFMVIAEMTVPYGASISAEMDENEDGVVDDEESMTAAYKFQEMFNYDNEQETYRFDGYEYTFYPYWMVDLGWTHAGGTDVGGTISLLMYMYHQGTNEDEVTFELDDFESDVHMCVEDTNDFEYLYMEYGTLYSEESCVTGLNEENQTLVIGLANLAEPMPEMVIDMIADFTLSNHEMGGVVLTMEWIQTMDANTSHSFRTMADVDEDGFVDAVEAMMMMDEMMDTGDDDNMPTPEDVLAMCDSDGDMGVTQMELEACTGIDNSTNEYGDFLTAFDVADDDNSGILEYDIEIQVFIDMAAHIMSGQGDDEHGDDYDHHYDEGEGHHHHGDGDYHHQHDADDETTHTADDRHHDHHDDHGHHNGDGHDDHGDHNDDGHDDHDGHDHGDHNDDGHEDHGDHNEDGHDGHEQNCVNVKEGDVAPEDGTFTYSDGTTINVEAGAVAPEDGVYCFGNNEHNHDDDDHGEHNNDGGPKMVCYWPNVFTTNGAHENKEDCESDGFDWLPELIHPENPTFVCYDTVTKTIDNSYDQQSDCESSDGMVWTIERTDEDTMWYCVNCNCQDIRDAEGYGEAPGAEYSQCYISVHAGHYDDDEGNDFPFFLNGVSVELATSIDISQSYTGVEGAINQSDNVVINSIVKFWFAGEQQGGEHVVQVIEADEPREIMFHCWDSPGTEGNEMHIPFSKVNDGTPDCGDGSDEPRDDDNDGDTDNWFDCHDGTMVSMDVVNDGVWDCADGEDEGMGQHHNDDSDDVNSFVVKFTTSPDYDVINGTHMMAGAYESFTGDHSIDFGGEPVEFDSYVVFKGEPGACPAGQYFDGAECVCQMPGMEVDANGVCVDPEPVTCPDNAHLHGNVCECNAGYLMDAAGNCVEDTTTDDNTDTTDCPEGQEMDAAGICVNIVTPEPVVDTSPNCYVYYWVGSNADVNGTDWSWTTLKEDWVEFNAPNNGSFTLALPLGDYYVFFNCWDNEGDDIEVSINNMPDQVAMWEDDYNYVTAWAMFSITDDMVGGQLDTSIVWSSTTFGGEIDITFKAVESLDEAVEESDVGGLAGLPGFTASIGVMALLGAALILARKEQE
ncbi:MAG: hypothetical protein CL997_05855, partial [Euryarchaeota archaeon]|nr:hypothetical protein [Euryarchaeota archaeon]